MPNLNIALVQANLIWEDPTANRLHLQKMFEQLPTNCNIIVLPEMFTTGFSMNTSLAETMQGDTLQWMRNIALQKNVLLIGSVMIQDEDKKVYNRLIAMQPDGIYFQYDKKHLFCIGKENDFYASGNHSLVFNWFDWQIKPLICYDLRFPVWCRNNYQDPYDALIFVANWPEKRNYAWKQLLIARAIENQCYVIGVNREGFDANNEYYSGDSCVVDPLGNVIYSTSHKESIQIVNLSQEFLHKVRTDLPFLKDADSFKWDAL